MMGAMPHYVKSHGLGNDYIVIDPANVPFAVTPEAVRLICDRHRGVGSDGILLVAEADGADFGVRIFNPLDAIEIDGRRFDVTSVSMGNPHCVVIVPDLAKIDVRALGPKIETHPAFSQR